jgi:hypothetical protein
VTRRDDRPDRPDRSTVFRLADWMDVGAAVRAAAASAETAPGERVAALVAEAYGRYSAARRRWTEEHGEDTLADLLERRRQRPVEWLRAERDAAALYPEGSR